MTALMLAPCDLSPQIHSAIFASATLAAGEECGVDGGRLRAVTLSYDIGPRATMAMGGVGFRNESHMSTHADCRRVWCAAASLAARLRAQQALPRCSIASEA